MVSVTLLGIVVLIIRMSVKLMVVATMGKEDAF